MSLNQCVTKRVGHRNYVISKTDLVFAKLQNLPLHKPPLIKLVIRRAIAHHDLEPGEFIENQKKRRVQALQVYDPGTSETRPHQSEEIIEYFVCLQDVDRRQSRDAHATKSIEWAESLNTDQFDLVPGIDKHREQCFGVLFRTALYVWDAARTDDLNVRPHRITRLVHFASSTKRTRRTTA